MQKQQLGRTEETPRDHRHWALILLGALCAVGLLVRMAILNEFLTENPFAYVLRSDDLEYWKLAGSIAQGNLLLETPLFQAPLQLYFLGLLRWMGCTLETIYFIQILIHMATAVIVYAATCTRLDKVSGLLAAGLFLLLCDPAIFATRLLPSTMQVACVSLLWWNWAALSEQAAPTKSRVARVGFFAGLAALAWPVFMLAVPLYGAWLLWNYRGQRSSLVLVAIGIAAALVTISPATIHNALAVGEFIPVTASVGTALRQGNGPEGTGKYIQLSNVSSAISGQHQDAADAFEAAHGRKGTWKEVNRFFVHQVLDWWKEDPLGGATLLAKKFYYFLTSKNYDSVVALSLERESGLLDRTLWAPIATPWLMGCALAGLILALRNPRRFAPELAIVGSIVLACVVFQYNARYRLPVTPVLCGLSLLAIRNMRDFPFPRSLVIAICFLPLLFAGINYQTGFDDTDSMRAGFLKEQTTAHIILGDRAISRADLEGALSNYEQALAVDPTSVVVLARQGYVETLLGNFPSARKTLDRLLELDPSNFGGLRLRYNVAVKSRDHAQARDTLARLVSTYPEDQEGTMKLAWLLTTSPDDAVRDGARALDLANEIKQRWPALTMEALEIKALAHAALADYDEGRDAAQHAAAQAEIQGLNQRAAYLKVLATKIEQQVPVRMEPRLFEMPPPEAQEL